MYTYVERIRTSIISRVPFLEWHFEAPCGEFWVEEPCTLEEGY